MNYILRISRRSVFFSISAIAASNVLLQTLGFLYRIFLSRMTGAEGVGLYSLVMPFYSVITSISLTGITVAVARISAERAAVRDFEGARKSVLTSRRIFVVAVFIISLFTLAFHEKISTIFLGDARCMKALPFTLICLLFTGFENIFKNYFYGVGRVVPQIVSELSEQIVRFVAVAALLLIFRPEDTGDAVALIILGMVISELFSSSLLALFYRPEKRRRGANGDKVSSSKILSVALPVSAAATLNNLLSSANAVLLPRRLVQSGLSAIAATESFGIMFGMTMPLLAFPIAFIAAITAIMVPKLSDGRARGDIADVRRKSGKAIHTTSLLAMPCMAILASLGEVSCRVIFKEAAAGEFMLPLSIATLLSYYQITTGALMNGVGMQRRAAVYIVLGGIVQLFFTWSVGLPHVGMRGFVAGYLVSAALTAALNFMSLARRLKLRPRIRNWFITPALASSLAGVITDISFKYLLRTGNSDVSALLLSAVLGIFVYCAALSALGTNLFKYLKTLVPKDLK